MDNWRKEWVRLRDDSFSVTRRTMRSQNVGSFPRDTPVSPSGPGHGPMSPRVITRSTGRDDILLIVFEVVEEPKDTGLNPVRGDVAVRSLDTRSLPL